MKKKKSTCTQARAQASCYNYTLRSRIRERGEPFVCGQGLPSTSPGCRITDTGLITGNPTPGLPARTSLMRVARPCHATLTSRITQHAGTSGQSARKNDKKKSKAVAFALYAFTSDFSDAGENNKRSSRIISLSWRSGSCQSRAVCVPSAPNLKIRKTNTAKRCVKNEASTFRHRTSVIKNWPLRSNFSNTGFVEISICECWQSAKRSVFVCESTFCRNWGEKNTKIHLSR